MLVDSDIVIDFLKGKIEAKRFFENNKDAVYISYISKFEILAGSSNKNEMKFLENFLSNFAVLPITNEILESAYEIFKDNFLKTKIGFADALISATAIFFDIPLASRNKKHYQTITRLKFILPY